ncbi:MmyB family transcriptional regulator [Streptomyces erythrochromogenes]
MQVRVATSSRQQARRPAQSVRGDPHALWPGRAHPDVGRITLTYQAFDAQAATSQYLLVGTAETGSTDADSLALLGSLHAAGRRNGTRPSGS